MTNINQNEPYHAYEIDVCMNELESSKDGLSGEQASKRLNELGENTLPKKERTSPFVLFFRQFKDLLVIVLFFAAIIAWFAGHVVDVYVIVGVVLANALIGFFQEYKAEKAIASLKSLVKHQANVKRDGNQLTVDVKDVVPGDILVLNAGESVPADARIFRLKNLETTESSLTGESMPVQKKSEVVDEDTNIADRKNMLYKGTHITRGSCQAVVIATGINTEIGKIAQSLSERDQGVSSFKKKTNKLAKVMAGLAVSTALVVILVGYFIRGFEFEEILLVTIATGLSSIPEGLPAVLSVVLAIGANRMARHNAIIRDFSATEIAGSLSVILTDKTGTLTQGVLTVKKIYTADGKEYEVEGQGYKLKGGVLKEGREVDPDEDDTLQRAAWIAAYSNAASVKDGGEANDPEFSGDPTELALLILAKKLGMRKPDLASGIDLIDDLPFNSKQKFRASLVRFSDDQQQEVIGFGAPEKILSLSTKIYLDNQPSELRGEDKERLLNQIESYGKKAMRVIAYGFKEADSDKKAISVDDVDKLVFAGFFAISDPLRDEVTEAVSKCKKAGIRVMMVTGDHKNTAVAIAREAGILDKERGDNAIPEALSEEELDVDDQEFGDYVDTVNVFARVSPKTKLRISEYLQKKGQIIGMTGDGVNDAPALKSADVGFAMGQKGTDVAKDASEMVLSDDNFASVVDAIQQGRIVFRNIRQTSFFLITTNFAATATLITAIAIGLPVPLLATQILWINLVTDGIMDIALATEPGSDDVMDQKPIQGDEQILNKQIFPYVLIIAPVMVILALLAFDNYRDDSVEKARTAAFLVIAMTQVWNALNMRSLKKSVFKIGLFKNRWINVAFIVSIILQYLAIKLPFMQNIFQFENLPWLDILIITLLSSLVFILGEVYKYFQAKRQKIK